MTDEEDGEGAPPPDAIVPRRESQELRRVSTPLATRVLERRTRMRARRDAGELPVLGALLELARTTARVLRHGAARLGWAVRRGRRPPMAQLPAAIDAQPVWVRGAVEPIGPVFETPGSLRPVVFAQTLFVNQPRPGQPRSLSDELRGVDFHIRLASGERIEVAAPDVVLGDPRRRIRRPNLPELERRGGDVRRALITRTVFVRERHVFEGDVVEAFGVLIRQVAPAGDAAFGRGTPLVTRLVPAPGQRQLVVRIVARAAG